MPIRADDVDLQRDRALVERFQAGDDAAFDELYRRYYRRLARFCQKRVLDRSEAEDVAQEAFVRALSAMPRFDGEKRFYRNVPLTGLFSAGPLGVWIPATARSSAGASRRASHTSASPTTTT